MIRQKLIPAVLTITFIYQLSAMQDTIQPLLVPCTWLNCKERLNPTFLKAHLKAHKQCYGNLLQCTICPKKYFYRNYELKKHYQSDHSQALSLVLATYQKIKKKETQKCPHMSYQKFCELESKIGPKHSMQVSRSAINKMISKRSKITQEYLEQMYDAYCRYECCEQFESQHSSKYRQHVLEHHPHLYNFHFCNKDCHSIYD